MMPRRLIALLALAAAWPPTAARAQPDDETSPTVLTIRPAPEPSPALKYTLLPPSHELEPGNAALFYHRAIERLLQTRIATQAQLRNRGNSMIEQAEIQISDWINGPLDQIPREEARMQLDHYAGALREVELGAIRESCDWNFAARPETYDLVISEIQEMRALARLVSLKVRLAVLDGDLDAALHWLQTGFAMARHVSEGPTLIQALVGVAISGVMARDMEHFIQAPGSPNLYWALAARPRPFIDMTTALEGEKYLIERMVPGFRELDGPPWSVERARQFADELQEAITMLGGSAVSEGGGEDGAPSLSEFAPRLGLVALTAKVYPDARRALIDSGRPEAEVEAMPAIQVVGLHAYRQFRELRDDVYKWTNLPYWQSYQDIDRVVEGRSLEEKLSNPGLAMFVLLQPALNGVRVAQVRADRQLDALQVIEAIRLYAAEHDGAFPPDLDALPVPAPTDPATGEPFQYAVDGDTASLTSELIPGYTTEIPGFRIRYELKMAE